MAATIAGIELGLRKHVKVYERGAEPPIDNIQQKDIVRLSDKTLVIDHPTEVSPSYNLPASRLDALKRLENSAKTDIGKILGNNFLAAAVAQHQPASESKVVNLHLR